MSADICATLPDTSSCGSSCLLGKCFSGSCYTSPAPIGTPCTNQQNNAGTCSSDNGSPVICVVNGRNISTSLPTPLPTAPNGTIATFLDGKLQQPLSGQSFFFGVFTLNGIYFATMIRSRVMLTTFTTSLTNIASFILPGDVMVTRPKVDILYVLDGGTTTFITTTLQYRLTVNGLSVNDQVSCQSMLNSASVAAPLFSKLVSSDNFPTLTDLSPVGNVSLVYTPAATVGSNSAASTTVAAQYAAAIAIGVIAGVVMIAVIMYLFIWKRRTASKRGRTTQLKDLPAYMSGTWADDRVSDIIVAGLVTS